jgi:hypothetical protein
MRPSKTHVYGAYAVALVAGCALFAQSGLKYSAQEQKNIAIGTKELKDRVRRAISV